MKILRDNEEAFTGLEAAIVFIAFVVVAAVFSYVVLGVGFFTIQKSQEGVHSGLTQAASNIFVKGDVYGFAEANTAIKYVQFDVGLAAGGMPVDMEKTVMIYSSETQAPYALTKGIDLADPTSKQWTIKERSTGSTTDDVLATGEAFTIKVMPDPMIQKREKFQIEIKPEAGVAFAVARTVPPSLTPITLLY